MISDSDQALATQQSIKKYVDDKAAAIDFISLSDTVSSYSVGRVLFETASAVSDSVNLIWDNVNNRLGVRKASPTEVLDVVGAINSDSAIKVSGTKVVGPQQTNIPDVNALTTVETAGAAYTANEQDMLEHLKTDVTELRSKVNDILSMLRAHGLMG
jgi:hypothetical protein